MVIKEKLGTLADYEFKNREIDVLFLEWFETGKRIMHKRTTGGKLVNMRFLKENPNLSVDDVIYADDTSIIVIDLLPADAIVLSPVNIFQTAGVCYEIGNRHLPLYYEENDFLVPFEIPLFNWLTKAGYKPIKQKRKLIHSLKSSVNRHSHIGGSSLFEKIMDLTGSSIKDAK